MSLNLSKMISLDTYIKITGDKRTFVIRYNKKADTKIINYYKRYFTNTKFRTWGLIKITKFLRQMLTEHKKFKINSLNGFSIKSNVLFLQK